MAQAFSSYWMFGCYGCGRLVSTTANEAPRCESEECPRFMEPLTSWHEIREEWQKWQDQEDGEGWKHP